MPHRLRGRRPTTAYLLSALLLTLLSTGLAIALAAVPPSAAADTVAAADMSETQRGGRPALSFRVASLNILGSHHTLRSRIWQPGPVRARLARGWLESERVSVVGIQEAQVDQMRVLTRRGRWQAFPDPRSAKNTETAQSVAWRRGHWELVKAGTFSIRFHLDQVRKQPMVQLRNRRTGRLLWVVTAHLTTGTSPRAVAERRAGTHRLVAHVNRLRRTGVPVVVTGDMNSRAEFFCDFSAGTGLRSPAGGVHDGQTCTPPWPMRIDWIFGTPQWSQFRYADGGVLDEVTDHDVPVAWATLPED